MSDIFVRAFTDNKTEFKHNEPETHNKNIRLIFDTETTIDQYQNLNFGSCLIQTKTTTGFKEKWYLFYGNITDDKKKTLLEYGKKHNIEVLPVREFVDKIFYPYAYKMRCEVIGFNLPFDLSRLAIDYGIARNKEEVFSFKLSEDKRNPRIRIESIDQKRSFISFTNPLRKKSEKRYRAYRGYFVDLKTFTFALTDRSYSLDSACKDFGASRKLHTEEHGRITEEYIDYNIQDVRSTAELYQKALERYKMFNLKDEPNKLYSPASIGKAYLEKMNIKPFLEQNPDFPKDILGYAMSSYYGGGTEVRIRNKSIPITYLDFTSMYPSVYSLLNLDQFLKAKRLKFKLNKENVKEFVKNLTLNDLNKPDLWKSGEMHSIVKIRPDNDILPVRAEYSKTAKNIGINYLSSDKELWFTVEDVIASKLLTGKTPEIVEAITFIPEDRQDDLKEVNISDITISPDEDFIRSLIEERIKVKRSNRSDKDQIQLILKIIANATSYGIYIEENTRILDDLDDAEVYSLNHFTSRVNKIEDTGRYFNPIMATLITGSARLILAMAESIAVKNGYIAYMDTDSIFVSPDKIRAMQDFFRSLNPYSVNVEMFKIEEDDNHNPLDNVCFMAFQQRDTVCINSKMVI